MDEYDFREHFKIDDVIYYLRVMPDLGVNEVLEGKIRTLESNYIVIARTDNTRQAVYISKNAKNFIYKNKKEAINESKKYTVRKVTIDRSDD